MSTDFALRFTGTGIGPERAGGKGAALDRLVALDAPVPPVGVLAVESYRAFAEQPAIAEFLEALRNAQVPAPADHDSSRALVDETFLSVPLPAAVADAVDGLVTEVSGGGQVAVRSSATAEDMGSASFAGQYESYLNIEPSDAHYAVRKVWASLWYPSPRKYRWFRGIDEQDLGMAVVVMQMLDPSLAGVLFTIDPGGRADAVRLEVVHGLGEQLVSGAVTPDAYVITRAGIEQAFASIAPPLADLAREAIRLEAALGAPQDIEFAVHHDRLFLVQARPITTEAGDDQRDDGFDFSCGIDTTYTTAGIAEMLPGVLSPLIWGVDSWLVENGFRSLFELLGGGADALTNEHALIGRFGGRAALNLDAMREAAASIPGGSPEELEQQYFGAVVPSNEDNRRADHALRRAGGHRVTQGVRVLKARRRAAQDSEIAIQAVARVVDREPDLATLDDAELFAYWNRLLHLAQEIVAAEVSVAAMAQASYRSVEVFLSRYMESGKASETTQQLTATDAAQRRSRVALGVEPVVAQLRSDPELLAAASDDWDTTRVRLEATAPGAQLLTRMLSTWRQAGSTGVFAGPTWEEVPQLAWMVVYQELVRPSPLPDPDRRARRRLEVERQLAKDKDWRATRWVTGQVLDVRRRFLGRQASEAAEFLDRRELTKAATLQLGGLARRAHVEFGRRLVEIRRLETVDDVELLGLSEMGIVCGAPGPSLQTIAHRRQLHREQLQAPALPQLWTGLPPVVSADDVVGERFEGWSASPGRYEGLARVLHSPDSTEFRRGDVLVATTTDASWTPLFMSAGAIVVEQGGPLSHAAIVARELGLPTVVNVPGFVLRLEREGGSARVVVDGTAGVVTVLTDAPDGDPELPAADASLEPRDDRDDGDDSDGGSGDDEPGAARPPVGSIPVASYAPARVPSARWDDNRLPTNVFVAGLMGASALMSAIVGLTESISSTPGRERLQRHATPFALTMADGAIGGYDAEASSATGLRSRDFFWVVAALAGAFGAALTARASDLYFRAHHGPLEWSVWTTSGATLLVVALLAAGVATVWPAVPPIVRRVAPGYPANPRSFWKAVPRPLQIAIAAMLTLVAIAAAFVTFGESLVLKIDRPIYFDRLHAGRNVTWWGPSWFYEFGRFPLTVIVPVVVFLIAFLRSRVVAFAYPLVIAVGGAVYTILRWIVNRVRPPRSGFPGEHTSFPGGHSIEVALVLLPLPLIVWSLTRNRALRAIGVVIPIAVWADTELNIIRIGDHWPVDHAAGLMIAASLLIAFYCVVLAELREQRASAEST